eukprot:scaffold992_cov175-Amphora_coffeaeformis.AAC.16
MHEAAAATMAASPVSAPAPGPHHESSVVRSMREFLSRIVFLSMSLLPNLHDIPWCGRMNHAPFGLGFSKSWFLCR